MNTIEYMKLIVALAINNWQLRINVLNLDIVRHIFLYLHLRIIYQFMDTK